MTNPPKKKKDVDYAALQSPLMQVPRIDVATVRDLMDLGFRYPHELAGRSPEVLFQDLQTLRPAVPRTRLYSFRMVIYYAETPEAERDRDKLHPWAWKD